MITVNPIAVGMGPGCQPLVFQCSKRHWHNWHASTDYICPEELLDRSLPIDRPDLSPAPTEPKRE